MEPGTVPPKRPIELNVIVETYLVPFSKSHFLKIRTADRDKCIAILEDGIVVPGKHNDWFVWLLFLKGRKIVKKTELAMLTTKGDIQRLIDEKFSEWDSIHESGSDGTTYMPDGYLLNNLRHDIIQLRVRKARLFDNEVVGQLTFDGGEVQAERSIPDLLPMNWSADNSKAQKSAFLKNYFAEKYQVNTWHAFGQVIHEGVCCGGSLAPYTLFFVFATYIFLERVVTVVQWRKVCRIILF